MSKLFVVGIGPGDLKHMTYEAREAIESAEVVVGYKTYLDFVTPLLVGKEVVSTGMTKEVERCREALRIAASGRSGRWSREAMPGFTAWRAWCWNWPVIRQGRMAPLTRPIMPVLFRIRPRSW